MLYERRLAILNYFSGEAFVKSDSPHERTIRRLFEALAFLGLCASLVLFVIGGLLRAIKWTCKPIFTGAGGGFCWSSVDCSLPVCADKLLGRIAKLAAAYRPDSTFYIPRFYMAAFCPLVSVLESKIKLFLLTQVTLIVSALFNFWAMKFSVRGMFCYYLMEVWGSRKPVPGFAP